MADEGEQRPAKGPGHGGPANGPGHGGPPRGGKAHGLYEPFAPGNQVGQRHGAYAVLSLRDRATEIAEALRGVVPAYSPADEAAVRMLAVVLTRVERATAALDQVDGAAAGSELGPYTGEGAPVMERLRQDCRGWINTGRALANDLGLTPTSRARLGLDISRTGDELRRYLDARYPEAGGA